MYMNCGVIGLITLLAVSYTTAVDLRQWMSSLPDESLLSNLDIPGTRDSCAMYGGDMHETQTMSLKEQLNAGIRYVDIGVRHIQNNLLIHRGVIYENLGFGDGVLKVIHDFLVENPKETVIMTVKMDKSGEDNTRTFDQTIDWYVSLYSGINWYLDDKIPNLGQVRGKLVFVRRYELDMEKHGSFDKYGNVPIPTHDRTFGIDLSTWVDGSETTHQTKYGNTNIIVQDYFVSNLFYGTVKWKFISNWLNEALKHQDETWYINVSGASSVWVYPYSLAKGSFVLTGMNERLRNFMVQRKKDKKRVGTIVMDFPESQSDLISLIIEGNF